MKLRYFLLPFALLQTTSFFGAGASAAASAAVPEVDAKQSAATPISEADTKICQAQTGLELTGRHPGLDALLIKIWLFERWVNANQCRRKSQLDDPNITLPDGTPLTFAESPECHSHCHMPYTCVTAECHSHCTHKCQENMLKGFFKTCAHMNQKAVAKLREIMAPDANSSGINMINMPLYEMAPYPRAAARAITNAVPAILPDIAFLIGYYLPEPIMKFTIHKHSCTYYLDRDELVITQS